MATLLHVTGDGHEPLPPFAGHLVRNLEWHRYSPEAVDSAVDTVVASPASPAEAVQLVVDLRNAGREQAVVLLVDGAPGWRSVGGAFDAVTIVEGLDALRELLGGNEPELSHLTPAELSTDDGARRHIPRGGSRGMLLSRLGDQAGQVRREDDAALWASLADGSRTDSASAQAAPGSEIWPDSMTGDDDDPPAGGAAVATGPRPPTPSPEPPRPRSQSEQNGASNPRRQRRETQDPDRLVDALLEVSERLYGVRETGTAVAGHVRDVVGVDAVAVLVPDGAVWAVVGAVGHRHLEERLLLGHEHWLVQEVTQVHHGVIVEDTDIARSRLAGAPLAAWPHLLACPVPGVDGLVVMARSDNGPAFSSRDLAHASQALTEAGPLFVSAMGVRELARRLRRYAELDDPLD